MEDETHDGAGEIFARRLREMRGHRGMSARVLSERLAAMGVTMSRVAITKLENEPKRAATVRLQTVLAISAALNVSPSWMVTPDRQDEDVRIAPGLCQPAGAVRLWLRGDFPLGGADPEDFFMMMPAAEYVKRRKVGLKRKARVAVIEQEEGKFGRGLTEAEEEKFAEREGMPVALLWQLRGIASADIHASNGPARHDPEEVL